MRDLKSLFQNRIIEIDRLTQYGFTKMENKYQYQTDLTEDFFIQFTISKEKQSSRLIDSVTLEEYILVDTETTGEFSSKMRVLHEQKIKEMCDFCTTSKEIDQTDIVRKYIQEKYQDTLEYLWESDSDSAIWRHQENQKWYGVLLKIEESKLGFSKDRIVSIIDLKYQKDNINHIIDHKAIFPGYHMNKKHWITIRLDGSLKNEELFALIDNSYQLTK